MFEGIESCRHSQQEVFVKNKTTCNYKGIPFFFVYYMSDDLKVCDCCGRESVFVQLKRCSRCQLFCLRIINLTSMFYISISHYQWPLLSECIGSILKPYASQMLGDLDRLVDQKHKLGKRIFEHYEYGDGWMKKKGMHWKTFHRHHDRYLRLDSSIDYQISLFL